MATEALFNKTYETLLKRVRIETASDEQTVELIKMTVSEVRVGFYKALGVAQVTEILTGPVVDNPSTEIELLRSLGASTEVLWVTMLLMQRLPNMFVAQGNSVNTMWNEEPLTKNSNEIFLESLKSQVDQGLVDLAAPEDEFESKTVRASSIGPSEPSLVTFPSNINNGWSK